ncbi:MAG: MBOAT family O-acyltransferase [Gemmatimonadaceae bacterium]
MLFQSVNFAIFLPIVLAIYWSARGRVAAQNAILAAASLMFYAFSGLWSLLPLAAAVLSAYVFALAIGAAPPNRRSYLLVAGVAINLSILGYFKYADFFADSLNQLLIGASASWRVSIGAVLLPVGISFYIFRTVSYIVDVARRDVPVERSLSNVFLYAAFFPYMLAGPVDRSKTVLPQLARERSLSRDDVDAALRLILWGLFKKIVIADSLADYVDYVFVNYADLAASSLAIGAVYFTLQLYADFSGYSDIAVGVARLFGLEITQNFRTPFFARSIAEFWRRWHISLYNWFNDYVFGPLSLALRDFDAAGVIVAVLITFTLSGLWHGAGWGFVVFGLLHGLYFIPLILKRRGRGVLGGRAATTAQARDAGWMVLTFACVVFAFVFFRLPVLSDAFAFLRHLASPTIAAAPLPQLVTLSWTLVLPAFEWVQRNRNHALDISTWHYTVRYPVYAALLLAIAVSIRPSHGAEYLYFKF